MLFTLQPNVSRQIMQSKGERERQRERIRQYEERKKENQIYRKRIKVTERQRRSMNERAGVWVTLRKRIMESRNSS